MAASEFCISMSAIVKSILRLRIVLDPLKQISADLNKAKEVLALIHDTVQRELEPPVFQICLLLAPFIFL